MAERDDISCNNETCGSVGTTVTGRFIDPELYNKIVKHNIRKSILHTLFRECIKEPITKNRLANILGIEYHKLFYQMNNQLKQFWIVVREEKIRGAHEEYIMPAQINAIYFNIGSEQQLFLLDPLANVYGPLKEVGTRCDNCSKAQKVRCLQEIDEQDIFAGEYGLKEHMAALHKANGRYEPTPVDFISVCTIHRSIQNRVCTIKLINNPCVFSDPGYWD